MQSEAERVQSLFELASLTSTELADVTSRVVGCPVRLAGVESAPFPYDWGSPATAGLWHVGVKAIARQRALSCAYFVKLLRHPRLWPQLRHIPDDARRQDFVDFFPWRFELDMYESGIGRLLPEGMRTPVLHHVKHVDADHVALWWEFVAQRGGPWRLADYQRAARCLGRLAARRRKGADVNSTLPEISRQSPPGMALRRFVEGRVMMGLVPLLQDGEVWSHPVIGQALCQARDPGLPADLLALAERLPGILDMLDKLPQTYAHGDASPQNLLRPADDPDGLVAIDWGFGSLLAIGFDLGQLLVGLAHAGEVGPSELARIDAAIFPAYLDGLRAESYDVQPSLVRAGYIGSLVARSALSALPFELLGASLSAQDQALFLDRLRLTRVLVDMAAEI